MYFLFWASFCILFYVYFGYLFLLKLIALVTRKTTPRFPVLDDGSLPTVTILLTVHNEENAIRTRLDNLLAQNYPKNKFAIVVASDGSTDSTNNIVAEYAAIHPIKLITTERLGKSGAQNKAIGQINSDIILFTDAQTHFEPTYTREIASPFIDPQIGCVTAQLLFETTPGTLSGGQGYYWSYELRLRQIESDLGLLAVASGAAMAQRRSLFKSLPASVGEDCIVPLDVLLQGAKVIHQPTAIAYDLMETKPSREFRTRIRMTMRNWTGTWMYPELLNPLHHCGYSFALWSHKLLRWLASIFYFYLLFISFYLVLHGDIIGWGGMLFSGLTLVQWLNERGIIKQTVPCSALVYSFTVANAGFFVGLLKALSGKRTFFYRAGQ